MEPFCLWLKGVTLDLTAVICPQGVESSCLWSGATFGESVLTDSPRNLTMVTREPCQLVRIEQRDFRKLWHVSTERCSWAGRLADARTTQAGLSAFTVQPLCFIPLLSLCLFMVGFCSSNIRERERERERRRG